MLRAGPKCGGACGGGCSNGWGLDVHQAAHDTHLTRPLNHSALSLSYPLLLATDTTAAMAKIEEVHDNPRHKPGAKKPKRESPTLPPNRSSPPYAEQPAVLKYYLVAYNLASALGWAYVLACLLIHLFNLDAPSSPWAARLQSIPFLSKAATVLHLSRTAHIEKRIPAALRPFLVPVLRRATTAYARVGWQTAVVQTCAVLEVVHSLLGWVRSPLTTVAMQVASRYYAVYGVTYLFESVRISYVVARVIIFGDVNCVVIDRPGRTRSMRAWSSRGRSLRSYATCTMHSVSSVPSPILSSGFVIRPSTCSTPSALLQKLSSTTRPYPRRLHYQHGVYMTSSGWRCSSSGGLVSRLVLSFSSVIVTSTLR